MTRRVTDLNHLETQLAEVESRLKQAVTLLNNLKTVQDKFKDLGTVYVKAKANIEGAKADLDDLEEQFKAAIQDAETQLEEYGKRFTAYEKASETRLGKLYADSDALVERTQARVEALNSDLAARTEQMRREHDEFRSAIRADLKTAEENLQAAFRNLRGDVEREGSALRGDMEKRLVGYRDELQTAVKRMDASVQETAKRMDANTRETTRVSTSVKTELKDMDARIHASQTKLNEDLGTLRGGVAAIFGKAKTLTAVSYLALVLALVSVLLNFLMP